MRNSLLFHATAGLKLLCGGSESFTGCVAASVGALVSMSAALIAKRFPSASGHAMSTRPLPVAAAGRLMLFAEPITSGVASIGERSTPKRWMLIVFAPCQTTTKNVPSNPTE